MSVNADAAGLETLQHKACVVLYTRLLLET